jgi:hypothetical protein
VTQLAVGDANCPAGGAAITDANNSTAYVCNGQAGADGDPFTGTFTAGDYSINVATTGITLSGPNSRRIVLDGNGMSFENGARLPLTIEGRSVDIEAATNVLIDAGSVFAADAPIATLKGAITLLDGSIVRLGGCAGTPVAKVGSLVTGTGGEGGFAGSVVTGVPTTLVC